MRTAILFLPALAGLIFASPAEDMNAVIDALYRADGQAVYRGLSVENQQALSMMISMFRLAPDQVAEQFRQELNVQITAAEILALTAEDLITIIINSPFFENELPVTRDMVSCESVTMSGDTALVRVALCGEDSIYCHPMLFQEGYWRIADNFFGER
jgi:hypothetical protein